MAGDVNLEVTIPEAKVTKVLDSFNTIADTHMEIISRGNDFDGHWDFIIEDKQPGENDKEFSERVLRKLGKAVIDMVDIAEDTDRYNAEIAALTPPESDVDPDILI